LVDRRNEEKEMAIALVMEFPGATQEQYDKVMKTLGLDRSDEPPAGALLHLAGPTEKGWEVIDVWESREDFDRFLREKLGRAIEEAGITPTAPKEFPVYKILGVSEPVKAGK
jgi:hypothetical protein